MIRIKSSSKAFFFMLTLGPKSACLHRVSAVLRKTFRLRGEKSFLALEESSSKITSSDQCN